MTLKPVLSGRPATYRPGTVGSPFTAGPDGYGAAMTDHLIVLRGGSRDGESTKVERGVRRLLAASAAPGMLEIYEANGETEHLARNAEDALVFVHMGQEAATDVAAELQHGP